MNLKDLELTRNQWDNFQKLRYWDLVEKARNPDGSRKGGFWSITYLGKAFLDNECKVSHTVLTYRGDRVSFEGERIPVSRVIEGYRYRPDYTGDAQTHML